MVQALSRVRIVSSNLSTTTLIRRKLQADGFYVEHTSNGRYVPAQCELDQPDLIIVDLQTLGSEGLELCQQIHQRISLPILVLGPAEEPDLLTAALSAGADDYVTIPLNPDGLRLRVQTMIQRSQGKSVAHECLRCGHLEIDRQSWQVWRDGKEVRLTAKERLLLELFVTHPGQVLTYKALLEHAWGPGYRGETNYIHTYVNGLRRKLEEEPTSPRYLLTEVGTGYRFVLPAPPTVSPTPPAPKTPTISALGSLLPPLEPRRPPTTDGFIGRMQELEYFLSRLANNHLAVITGMTGMGKTALATMLATHVASTPAKIFWHTFHEDQGMDTVIWGLAGFLAYHGNDAVWQTLQQALQSGGKPPPSEVLITYLLTMLKGHGYVLCFDDFQAVDATPLLIAFFKELQTAAGDGSITLIITAQRLPTTFDPLAFQPLQGLTLEDTTLLLEQHNVALDEPSLADLHARTEGNVQLLLLASEVLRGAEKPSRLINSLSRSNSIEHFLLSRVDQRLSDGERRVMGTIAALLGFPAEADSIEIIGEHQGVQRTLHDLSARSLLIASTGETDRSYTQHALVRAFYYDHLGRSERRRLHLRAAEYYAQEYEDTLAAVRHFQHAGEPARAAQLMTEHVQTLINRGQAQALQQLLAEATPQQLDPTTWVAVLLARAEVAAWLEDSRTARAVYQTALTQLDLLPANDLTRRQRARACLGMGEALLYDVPKEALTWTRRGVEALGDLAAPERAALYLKMGGALITLGEYAEARAAVEQGLQHLADGPSRLRVNALINLGTIACAEGDRQRGNTLTLQALELSQQLHDSWAMIPIWTNLGVETEIAGDWEGAEGHYQQALSLAAHLGSKKHQAALTMNLGILKTNQGDHAAAEAYLQQGLALAEEAGVNTWVVAGQASLADLYIRQARYAEAERLLETVEPLALEVEAHEQLPEIHRGWALVHMARRDLAAASEAASRALELAKGSNLDIGVGVCLRVLGQVRAALGDLDGAGTALQQSQTLLEDLDPYELARTLLARGRLLIERADQTRGAELLQDAHAIFARLGARYELALCNELIETLS